MSRGTLSRTTGEDFGFRNLKVYAYSKLGREQIWGRNTWYSPARARYLRHHDAREAARLVEGRFDDGTGRWSQEG